MKRIIWLILFCGLTSSTNSESTIKVKGVVLIHYNANFNSANNYVEIAKIKDAKIFKSWIDENPEVKDSERIRSVPTIILYDSGKEIKRWEAGLNLKLTVPLKEIQQEVDDLTGANKF
ncbi:MAG: hypothetical protein CL833_06395 [Crocinitomicaceae bacterium]|nr:hypothetical protein [Crocinitomicaceae bacterium]|tara:strand:+ start:328 stop:681 length:354 start_codon:yes stop_codon:yes gene_type:complete